MNRPYGQSTLNPPNSRRWFRSAFTLVEMLVSVTLVVLMMLMFAQIFQLAAGSVTTQRGIAQNDQRGRTVQTMIRADLDKRTFRSLIPFAAGEKSGGQDSNLDQRQGYFYISEGNPKNDADDVLQFTVRSSITLKNRDQTPYFGRAFAVGAINNDRNQPEWDDGVGENGASISTEAEVVYFLRGGNLYRRVMLIRNPVNGETQPTDNMDEEFASSSSSLKTAFEENFWQKFDFAAFPGTTGITLHGSDSLQNDYNEVFVGTTPSRFPLGIPKYRFGFFDDGVIGSPREYLDTDDATDLQDGAFIGRFTHQETSDNRFTYPETFSITVSDAGPMHGNDSTPAPLTLTNGVVDQLNAGTRRAEDILLTNVVSFDVKVLDPFYNEDIDGDGAELEEDFNKNGTFESSGGFADIGHATFGLYGLDLNNVTQNRQPTYGPFANGNRVFDTWHPGLNFDGNTVVDENDDPPYGVPERWKSTKPTYAIGDLVIPSTGNRSLIFRRSTAGAPVSDEPIWPTELGGTVYDQDGTTVLPWQTVTAKLTAIQITIRYLDPSNTNLRQLTIVQSLVD